MGCNQQNVLFGRISPKWLIRVYGKVCRQLHELPNKEREDCAKKCDSLLFCVPSVLAAGLALQFLIIIGLGWVWLRVPPPIDAAIIIPGSLVLLFRPLIVRWGIVFMVPGAAADVIGMCVEDYS